MEHTNCHSARDGECSWAQCPQNRDGEPGKSGRHCPLDTEQAECDACEWRVLPELGQELHWYASEFPGTSEGVLLCRICRETLIGRARRYPRQYENRTVLFTLGYIGNLLLTELQRMTASKE